jgi:hypothetical protein
MTAKINCGRMVLAICLGLVSCGQPAEPPEAAPVEKADQEADLTSRVGSNHLFSNPVLRVFLFVSSVDEDNQTAVKRNPKHGFGFFVGGLNL